MTKPVDPGCEPAETVGFIRSTIVLPQRGTVCYRAGVRTITEAQLRNESTAILRDVQSGHSMIVTRDGMPVAELKPVSPRRFVPRDEIARDAVTAPRIDAARFRADLDACVDQDVDARQTTDFRSRRTSPPRAM